MSSIHLIIMPQYSGNPFLPPLGLACLGAYLKQNGIDVTTSDFRLLASSNDSLVHSYYDYGKIAYVSELPDLPLILSLVSNYKQGKPLLHRLQETILNYIPYRSFNLDELKNQIESIHSIMAHCVAKLIKQEIIGFTTVASNFFFTIMLSLLLRRAKPNIKIIYGGPQTTLSLNSAKLALKLGIADIVIPGEGEETLLRVIRAYNHNRLPAVEGTITYDPKRNFSPIKSFRRPLNLDNLPDPDFSPFDLRQYSPFSLPLYASKGCIFRCTFCTYCKLDAQVRFRNPIKVVDTMEELHRKYNAIRFYFSDSALNNNPPWLEQFAEELIRRNCNLQWGGFFRPWMTEKLLAKIEKAGLHEVIIGVESFSSQTLKKMGKGDINADEIIKTIEMFSSADIKVGISLIVGFPGESKSDFLHTWKQLLKLKGKNLKNVFINPQYFQLRPNSECFERYDKYGLIVKKWNKKICNAVPEANDIIKNMKMAFYGKKPRNDEISYRYEMVQNIRPVDNIGLSGKERKFLKRCLKEMSRSSRVWIGQDLEIKRYHEKGDKEGGGLFIIEEGKMKIPLTDQGTFIVKNLNQHNTISEIIDLISLRYQKSKRISQKLLMDFLNHLIENGISLKMRNSVPGKENSVG